jgi:hypothetical protein
MLELNKNGQIGTFLLTRTLYEHYDIPSNICVLFWALVGWSTAWVLAGVVVSYTVIAVLLALVSLTPLLGFMVLPDFIQVTIVVVTIATILSALVYVGSVTLPNVAVKVTEKAASTDIIKVIATYYRSHKEKYCALVDWK